MLRFGVALRSGLAARAVDIPPSSSWPPSLMPIRTSYICVSVGRPSTTYMRGIEASDTRTHPLPPIPSQASVRIPEQHAGTTHAPTRCEENGKWAVGAVGRADLRSQIAVPSMYGMHACMHACMHVCTYMCGWARACLCSDTDRPTSPPSGLPGNMGDGD